MPRAKHRIVFAGGGTGGHLYPALAVAEAMARRWPGARISFVGARRGLERDLVPRAGYAVWLLPLSGIKGRGPLRLVGAVAAAGWSLLRCLIRFAGQRPDLVVGVGGYASGPPVLAAWLLRIKTMVMEQNHYPGATNRSLARRVDTICLPSEAAKASLGGVGVVTGNPVRAEFAAIGEPPSAPALSLLIFGGSRGAHSINCATIAALPRLAQLQIPPRIVHQTGTDDESEVRAAYARDYLEGSYEVHPFLHEMSARLAAADLVLCRAGASTLAELTAAGRPAILVPYPHAADDHQRRNAETLRDARAARLVLDDDLDGGRLADLVSELQSDGEELRAMGRAARSLGRPDAAQRIVDIADQLISGNSAEGADVS